MLDTTEKPTKKTRENASPAKKVLLLTTSLLTDRMFVYSGLLENLAKKWTVKVWSKSFGNPRHREMWKTEFAAIEKFPQTEAFPEFPHNYLRRLNEFVWDYTLKPPSRLSLEKNRRRQVALELRLLKPFARILAAVRLEKKIESSLGNFLSDYERSAESVRRLTNEKPEVVIVTGPFQFEQPAVVSAAKKLGIPVLALIPSWDNLSTKKRFIFDYDGYLVWSKQTRRELLEFYPNTHDKPIYVTGAMQFDVFFDESFYLTREEFCRTQNLNPDLPLIVYAVGSPNFLQEHHGALETAKRIIKGELGDVQMIVRPHPLHDEAELHDLFDEFLPRVRVQKTVEPGEKEIGRSQNREQIIEWINTFRHADVVINLSSTVTIDAAIFDRPVVNLDFDPQPGQADQKLIKEINHLWTHFKPVAESGAVQLVNDFDELIAATGEYLKNPAAHREERRRIVEYVCGYADGKCGARTAQAIADFIEFTKAKSSK